MVAERKYSWEDWFGRWRTVLVRGVHYQCSQSTMAQSVRNAASRLRVRVKITDTGTELVVEVVGDRYEIPGADTVAVADEYAHSLDGNSSPEEAPEAGDAPVPARP